jgi:hypothetical protein
VKDTGSSHMAGAFFISHTEGLVAMLAHTNTLTITSPNDLAASVPSLIGFRPEQSLILIYLAGDGIALTCRFDLPITDDITAQAADLIASTSATASLAVLCAPRREADQHRAGLKKLQAALKEVDAPLRDALLLDGERFWSITYATLEFTPHEGMPVPEACVVEADGVMRGIVSPACSREEYVDRYRHRPDDAVSDTILEAAQAHLAAPIHLQAQRAWDALQRLTEVGLRSRAAERLDRAVVWVGVSDVRVRDYLILRISETPDARPLTESMTSLALCAPDGYLARTAGTAAFLQYIQGRSLPAQCLSDLAGDDSLGRLVTMAVACALPPAHLQQGMQDVRDTVLEGISDTARPSA